MKKKNKKILLWTGAGLGAFLLFGIKDFGSGETLWEQLTSKRETPPPPQRITVVTPQTQTEAVSAEPIVNYTPVSKPESPEAATKSYNENPQKYDYSEFSKVLPFGKVKITWMGQIYNPKLKKTVGYVNGGISTISGYAKKIGVKTLATGIGGRTVDKYYLHKSYIDSDFGNYLTYKELTSLGVKVELVN